MKQDSTIYRHRISDRFTPLSNDILQDEQLTFYAKGLLVYLISLPPDWNISVKSICKKFEETETRILKAFKELIELGFCLRKPSYSNGRLSGQSYFITDCKFDFGNIQPPQKITLLEKAAPPENQTTENTVAQENESALKSNINKEENNITDKEKNGSLFSEDEIEVKEKKKKGTSENLCLFKNSKFFEFTDFEKEFDKPDFQMIDVYYYYNAVADWSASKGKMMKDWIATARNFMRSDKEKNKLHLKDATGKTNPAEALDYLKNFS